jgi:hypothetical protein
MTKYLSTPTNAVLVAIDMSKYRQEVLIGRPEGGRRRRSFLARGHSGVKPDRQQAADLSSSSITEKVTAL